MQRQTTVDGLGRIVDVLEQDPDNSGSLTFETSYIYNPADQLIQSVQGVQVRTFHYDSAGRLLSEFHPEAGTKFYSYDGNGNLTESVDARGKRITRTYDELNRVEQVDYGDISNRPDSTPTVTYFYEEDSTNCPESVANTNGDGRLSCVFDGLGSTTYKYDEMGRITTLRREFDNVVTLDAEYDYNFLGGVTVASFPDILDGPNSHPLAIYYGYDNAGRQISAYWDNDMGMGSMGAAVQELVEDYTFSHGTSTSTEELTFAPSMSTSTVETITYNNRLQPTQRSVNHGMTSLMVIDTDFTEPGTNDNNGNVYEVDVDVAGTSDDEDQLFTYDVLNRLTGIDRSSGDRSYDYDRYGNRTCTSGCSGLTSDDKTNRISTENYHYDATGNLIGIPGGRTYTYDAENRLIASSVGSSYAYDYAGRRVMKDDGVENPRYYFYDPNGNPVWEFLDDPNPVNDLWETFNLYFNGSQLATNTAAGSLGLVFLHRDHLGTPRVKSKINGDVVDDGMGNKAVDHYYPFGEQINTPVDDGIKNRFTGKERDSETGLDYFGARYHDASLGRFTSIDPSMQSFDISDPRSFNRYVYVLNNPLRFVDPDGECSRPAGMSGGQIGICIATFIAAERVGPFLVGKGDGRGPIADDRSATFRTQTSIVVDPAALELGIVSGSTAVGTSEVGAGFLTFSAQGTAHGGVVKTRLNDGSLGLTVSLSAKNGFGRLPFSPAAIDLSLGLMITSEGLVKLEGGQRDAYPSLEIFVFRPGQQPELLLFLPETQIEALNEPMEQEIPSKTSPPN